MSQKKEQERRKKEINVSVVSHWKKVKSDESDCGIFLQGKISIKVFGLVWF